MFRRAVIAALIVTAAVFVGCAGTSANGGGGNGSSEPVAPPGQIEEVTHPNMDEVLAAQSQVAAADGELVIYYYRSGGNYEPWGVWLWAFGEGDGADNWPYTQDFEVANGVAYLRVKQDGSDIGGAPVSEAGEVGFIIRQDSEWVKDGEEDRVWDIEKGNEVVVFSGDQVNYAVGEYTPDILQAGFTDTTTIEAQLSGRHALEVEPSDNDFVVKSVDGSSQIAISDITTLDNPDDRTQNYSDRIRITLAERVDVSETWQLAHPEYLAPTTISTAGLVAGEADNFTPPDDVELGAVYDQSAGSVTFRVWSPFASSMTAQLYQQSGQGAPDYSVELNQDQDTGVWSGSFGEIDPNSLFYDFIVEHGSQTFTILDPYAASMDAYRDTGDAGRGAIVDMDDADAQPDGGWEGFEDVALEKHEDAIIYEVQVRDYTISTDAEVDGEPGTYSALIEKLPYIRDLGVTHIQLLPVLNFYFTDETDREYEDDGTASNNNYNWGYDPHNWFSPEGWFSTDATDPYARIRELRTLIKEIHRHDMGVLLDVVYNHYGNTNLLEHVVPNYYFRRTDSGAFTNSSGVGNDFASTRPMARRLIVDSIYHWVSEYNIDGFRFDLMGLIDTETILNAYDRVRTLPGKEDILFEGEGWKMYNGPSGTVGMDQDYMTQTDEVAVFNDEVRDLLKAGGFNEEGQGFLTKRAINTEQLYRNLIGQPQSNYSADDPGDNMNYIAAHDGLTLHDSVSHNAELDPSVDEEKAEIAARVRMGNFLILTSQGIPFLHGGQERLRTKPRFNAQNEVIGDYVRNSYDSSDNINQIVWTTDQYEDSVIEFTRSIIDIRKEHPIFRLAEQSEVNSAAAFISTGGTTGLQLAYSLTDADGATYFVLANAAEEEHTFNLGETVSGGTVLSDGTTANADGLESYEGVTLSGPSATLDPLTSALILVNN